MTLPAKNPFLPVDDCFHRHAGWAHSPEGWRAATCQATRATQKIEKIQAAKERGLVAKGFAGRVGETQDLPTLLLPDSGPEDLQAVACATHKDVSDATVCLAFSWNHCFNARDLWQRIVAPDQRYFCCLAAPRAVVPEAALGS